MSSIGTGVKSRYANLRESSLQTSETMDYQMLNTEGEVERHFIGKGGDMMLIDLHLFFLPRSFLFLLHCQ
jgi:hypothetical protein